MCRMHDPVHPADCPKRESWHSLSGEARPIARFADWSQAETVDPTSNLSAASGCRGTRVSRSCRSTLGKSFVTPSLLPATPVLKYHVRSARDNEDKPR